MKWKFSHVCLKGWRTCHLVRPRRRLYTLFVLDLADRQLWVILFLFFVLRMKRVGRMIRLNQLAKTTTCSWRLLFNRSGSAPLSRLPVFVSPPAFAPNPRKRQRISRRVRRTTCRWFQILPELSVPCPYLASVLGSHRWSLKDIAFIPLKALLR